MADENKVPSNLEFNQQDLNYIPDPNVFKDMPSDLDYNIMFENFRDTVNSVVYPDNYQPTKSFSSGKTGPNYNPYNENVKFSNNQLDILKEYSNQVNEVKKDDKPLSPILTSKKLTDYERYYNHPKFQELGFNPFRDNETLYNENSTVWDDFSRMGTQFSKLLYTGFVSSYRSLGDLFDDDDYFTGKDLDSAREFSEAMRIGNSTRGGVGGFLNNLGLQSAYTFGIIMNVAVEEALLSFATGGGSLFTAPVRGAVRAGESLKKMTRIDEVRKGLSANVINRLEDVDEAKTFFQAVKSGDSRLMGVLLPETMAARRSLNSASNTVNHLSDIGKQVKTFGGFYRDMRGLNFALSESKMEGGMVYDQVVANGLSERMKQSETGILSDSDFQIIKDNANKASMATTMLNAPFIYLSNQLLLGTAFGGFNKSLAKAIGDNTDAFARRIITKPIRDAEGKIIDATARATSRGFAGTLEKFSAEGFRKMSGAMALRYFANNFGEGIQEVYQEAVAKGTEYYYESIIKDPVSQQKGLFMSSIAEGMGSQMSGQGFHTFMSGFLMGGLVSGPQQVLFRGVPNIAKYVTNREEYNKQNEIFEKQLEEYVKNYNKVFKEFSKNPTDFFNTSLINTTLQKMVSEDNAKAVDIDSVFDFLNGKDAAKFVHIHSLLSNNSVNIFRKQLNDYLKLSDEDIATAFPMLKEEAKKGKAKERITSLLEQVDKVEEDYIKYKDKFQNPFDESKFDIMKQPQEFFNEILKRKAFEHVTFLAMFSSNQIRRTAQRMQSMYSDLESVPLFEGMAANDLTVLLSEKRLQEEINLLRTEIELLEDSKDKKGLKEKKQKFEDLQKIFEVSQMKSKKGVYDKRRQKTLTKAIIKYANNLAKNNDTTVDTLEIDNVIRKIFDYAALEKDNFATRQTVEMLNDPNKFNELFDRTLAALTKVSSKQQYRNNVAKLFATANFRKYLYDKLENNNITLDVEELTKFAESDYADVNTITKVFINGVESTDPEQVNQIRNELQALSDIYQKVKQDQEEQEETEDGKLAVSPRVEQLLSRLGIELPNKLTLAQEKALEDYINNIKIYFNLFNVDITSETNEKIIEDFATVLSIIAVNNNIPIDKLNDVLSGFLQKTIDENSVNLIQSFLELPEVLEIKDVLNEYIKGQGEQVFTESQDQQIVDDELQEDEEDTEEDTEEEIETKTYLDQNTGMSITAVLKDGKYNLYYKSDKDEGFISDNLNLRSYFNLFGSTTFDSLEEANEFIDNLSVNPNAKFIVENNGKQIVITPNMSVYDIKTLKEYKVESNIVDFFNNNNIAVNGNTYTVQSFFENFTTEKPPKSKSNTLSSVDNDVRLIPEKDSNGNTLDARSFQVALMSLDLEDSENVTITLARNDAEPQTRKFQPDKNEDANEFINYKKAPYYISISISDGALKVLNSKLDALGFPQINQNNIAILNTGNMQYLDANGNPINNPTQITEEQAKLYYSLLNEDNKSVDFTKSLYDQLINNFASQQVLNSKVESLIEEGKTELSLKEFQEQTGISFRQVFSYDYSKSETNNLNDLAFNEFDGQITIFQNIYDPSINKTTTTIVRGSSTSQEAFDFAVNNNNIQGYIAVVKLPNGRLVYVPLKASVLSEEQISEKVDEIKKQLEEINKDSNNAKKIKEFNDSPKFFISLNKYEYVDMYYLKESDKLLISYVDKSTTESKRITVALTPEEYKELTPETLQQKFDELNTKIEKYYKQNKQSETPVKIEIGKTVRNYFPKNTGLETLSKNTETNLSNKIFKSFNLVYQASTEDVTQQKDNIKNKQEEVVTETKKDTKTNIDEGIGNVDSYEDYLNTLTINELNKLKRSETRKAIEAKKNGDEEAQKQANENRKLINKVLATKGSNITKRKADLIISDNHDEMSIEDIETFTEWMKENLPDYISIDDIETLTNNMLRGGMRVGAFVLELKKLSNKLTVQGKILTSKDSPGKYHEAFHAVFRMLLSDKQIDKLLSIAKKEVRAKLRAENKNYIEELSNFRNLSEEYESLSAKELEDLYLEEYMANEFDKFKSNPRSTKTNPAIKNFFSKLIDIIKSLFKGFVTLNNKDYANLNDLFIDIDTGKYKSATLMDNRFTSVLEQGDSTIANALIPYFVNPENENDKEYLDSSTGDALVANIYARVVNLEFEAKSQVSISELVDESIALFKDLYQRNLEKNKDEFGLYEVNEALDEFSDVIKEQVLERLRYANITQENIDEFIENDVQNLNETGLNTNNYNMKAELLGMEKSLPTFIRKYFASTTLVSVDKFGNEFLVEPVKDEDGNIIQEGERIVTSINPADAYSGFLRATQNIYNPVEMFKSLIAFSESSNPETKAVVDRMLLDTGLTRQDVENLINTDDFTFMDVFGDKDTVLLNKILKAFENTKFSYRFQVYESAKGIVTSYDSMQNNAVKAQLDQWTNEHIDKLRLFKNSAEGKLSTSKKIERALNLYQGVYKNDQDFKDASKEISQILFDTMGITLHPMYIQYSIVSDTVELNGQNVLNINTKYQQFIYNINKDTTPFKLDDLQQLQKNFLAENYLLQRTGSLNNIMKKLANNNVRFDESIGTTTFLNPENEKVYAHQLPTFNARMAYMLENDFEGTMAILLERDDLLKYNYLFNSPEFRNFVEDGYFNYERIAGLIIDNSTEDKFMRSGKSYGKFNIEDFLLSMLGSYTSLINKRNGKQYDSKGNEVNTAMAPIFTRVAETSRTGPSFMMPIIKAVDSNGNISQEVVQIFYNYLKGEFERIQKESDFTNQTPLLNKYNSRDVNGELVRDDSKETTAFTLFKTKGILNNQVQSLYEIEESYNNAKLFDKITNDKTGTFRIKNSTKLGKQLIEGEVNKITITKGKKEQEVFLKILSKQDNEYTLEFSDKFNPIQDNTITDKLEELAKKSENRGKSFEEILEAEPMFKIEQGIPTFIREKLEADFNRFLYILKGKNIDISNEDSAFYKILSGDVYSLDLSWMENLDYQEEQYDAIEAKMLQNYRASLENYNLKEATDIKGIKDNLKQIYFNHFINASSLNQLFLGDHAKMFKSFQQEVKRGKSPEAHGTSTKTPFASQRLGVGPVESFDLIPGTEPKNTSAISGNEIEVADGQLYMTVKTFKHILWGLGELFTEEHSRLLDKIDRGEKLTSEEIFGVFDKYGNLVKDGLVQRGEMMNLKKYIYADAQNLVKMSAHVIRRADVSEKNSRGEWVAKDNMVVLHNMLNKMEQHQEATGNLTMMAPLSAIKKLQENVNDINKIQSTDSLDVDSDGNPMPLGAMKLDAEFFMLQQKNPSNKQEVTDPTQITWLLLNEQDDNQKVSINGEEMPISDVKKNFEAFKSYILSLNHVGKRNLTFQESMDNFNVNKKLLGNDINLASFARYAAESKKASQSSSEKLEFFELDKNGNLKYDLNSPITNKDFEDLLLSYFSKQVFKQKIPGSQLTITSDHGRRIYRRVFSVKKVTLNGVTYVIPDKQETLRSDEVQRFAEIKNNVQFHIDKDVNGNVSNVGDDSNLNGLEEAIKKADGKGVIIIDRLRYDMEEYTYEDKNDISTWTKTGQRYSEGIMPAITKEVYKYLNKSSKDTRVKFTNEKLLELYEEWSSLENYPVRQGKKIKYIARKNTKNYNEELGKISFAKQMGVFYDKKKKEFISNSEFSVPEVLAKLFALRIPTQDKHSALAVKIVDFMDATNGSTISVAREIVEVSGADFDIDKLFAHMKDIFYNNKTGNFVAYGETKGEEFSDYIRYVNNKVRKPGNIYFEAYEKFKTTGRLPYGVELTDKEIQEYEKANYSKRAYIALKTLGLPLSLDKFEEFKNQYGYYPLEAMMQNKVLDYKFALVGNKSVTETTKLYKDKDGNLSSSKKQGFEETDLELPAVSYEPADMEVLEKIKKEFEILFPQWKETILDDLFDNDTLTGALLAYQNNQVGSRLIGAAVLPNSYLPKLGTLGISVGKEFSIEFNGKTFNKYGAILEDNGDSTYGYRTQYLMSALISAMVDNATEQYAGKFGININSLGVVSNFVMMGVPLKTSLMMVLNPTLAKLYNQTETGSDFKKSAYDILNSITNRLKDFNISTSDNLTNKLLENNINSNLDIDKILEKKNDDITEQEIQYMSELYTIMTNYMKGVELSDYNFSLGVLFSMQKGIKSTEDLFKIDEAINNLGLEKDNKTLKSKDHPFDAKKLFVYENDLNAITRTLYNAYKNLKFEMLPKLVTTQTEAFIDLFNAVTDKNLGFVNKKGKNKIKYDLASYLILKEYYNDMMSQENKEFLDSLSNNIIYPIDNNSNKNKSTIVNKIFAALENKEDLQIEDNFFINQFITIKSAYLAGNYTNLDIISNNLMSKIPDHRKFDIQSDFIKLFKDAKTRSLAVDIFHYLLVKDGLQFRQDSIVQVISPVIMQDYLSSSASIFEKFSKYQGVNLSELITDFISNYYKSANINQDGDIRLKFIKNVQEKPRNKEEQVFLNESDNNIIFEDKELGELVINPYKLPFPQNRFNDTLTTNGLSVINRNNREQEIDKKSQILSNSNIFTFFSKKTKEDKLDQYIFPTFLSYKGKLYEISKVVSKQEQDQIFTKDKPYYVGLSARYKVADIKGSSAQWGAGFVLGNVPDQTKLAENVRENKDIQFEKYLREQEQDDLLSLDNVESNLENDDVLFAKKRIDEELEKQGKDIADVNKLLGTNFKNTTELAEYLTNSIDQTDTKTVEEFLNCKGLTINLDF